MKDTVYGDRAKQGYIQATRYLHIWKLRLLSPENCLIASVRRDIDESYQTWYFRVTSFASNDFFKRCFSPSMSLSLCMCVHVCACTCKLKAPVYVRICLALVFYFIHWGMVSQPNLGLTDMGSLPSQLALWIPTPLPIAFAFWGWNYISLNAYPAFTWVLGNLNSPSSCM